MDSWVLHQNRSRVLEAFHQGEFDHIEILGEVLETRWFEFLLGEEILERLAQSYPTPRSKQEIPLWIYVAAELSMRLHGTHSFHSLPLLIQSGGLLEALGPAHGRRAVDPETGDLSLSCAGFNHKNRKERRTPVHHDTIRKLARQTPASHLEGWFNRQAGSLLRDQGALDPEGLYLGDATYLFVPDNPRYEGSVRLLFDEHNHVVDPQTVRPEDWPRLRWRRCYKMISVLHVHPNELCFTYVGVHVLSGRAHEVGPFYDELLPQVVQAVGRGQIRTLVLDRGFIDGERIGRVKTEFGIDVLIPLKSNMEILKDAQGLARDPGTVWAEYVSPRQRSGPPPLPEDPVLRQREETRRRTLAERREGKEPEGVARTRLAVFPELRTLDSCPVPLTVILMREEKEGKVQEWGLATTRSEVDGLRERARYEVRVQIEERHRQLKGFWDLTRVRSRAFTVIVNQVVFTLLGYTLLELFLWRIEKELLNRATLQRIRRELSPTRQRVAIYQGVYWTTLSVLEYTDVVANLSGEAREKLTRKVRELRESLGDRLKGWH